jgi:hypothetical protein
MFYWHTEENRINNVSFCPVYKLKMTVLLPVFPGALTDKPPAQLSIFFKRF